METKHANFYHEHTIEHALSDILVNQAQRQQSGFFLVSSVTTHEGFLIFPWRLEGDVTPWRGSHHSPSKSKTLF